MPVGIELNRVCKSFKKLRALDDITITFAEGKLHGLIGSEGAGKTTLMRVIMELLLRDSGEIVWRDDGKMLPFQEVRDRIAYMPGSQSLYPDLSVDEHLKFFRELYSLSADEFKRQRERLLEITRLSKFTKRRARELSGGMYKKLGLMCALLLQPSVLLLDEPTNGVDPISRREFWDMLYDLSSQKITIIISTAYMDEAERCHEAHLLDAGKHLVSGEPRKLLADAGVSSFDEYYMKQGSQNPEVRIQNKGF